MNNLKHYLRYFFIAMGGFFYRFLGIKKDKIIALHEVSDQTIFEEKMRWLCHHYTVVSLETLLFKKNASLSQRVAITFDDGYENWLYNALPVLEKLKIPAVLFVNSGLIGLSAGEADYFVKNRLRRRQSLTLLSTEALLTLANHPLIEIGGHGQDHLDMASLHSEAQITQQIVADKEKLEKLIGQPLRWFAYPFGGAVHFTSLVIKVVQKAGYLAAFTIIPDSLSIERSPFAVGRTCLELTTTEKSWQNCLAGGCDFLTKLTTFFTVIKK